MNARRSLWMMLLCVPLLSALALGFGKDPHAVPSVLVGKPSPAFVRESVTHKRIDSAALRGRPVLINFWATWCYPCQAEHPMLQAVARQTAGALNVLGVIYEDTPEAAEQYLRQHPSPYEHLIDPNSELAIDFGVAGVPETFLLDANGIVRFKHSGVLTAEVLTRELVPLLEAAKSHGVPGPHEGAKPAPPAGRSL